MDVVRCVWVLALFQLIEVRLIDSQISLLPKESDTVMPGWKVDRCVSKYFLLNKIDCRWLYVWWTEKLWICLTSDASRRVNWLTSLVLFVMTCKVRAQLTSIKLYVLCFIVNDQLLSDLRIKSWVSNTFSISKVLWRQNRSLGGANSDTWVIRKDNDGGGI